jgi:hypothetical protein
MAGALVNSAHYNALARTTLLLNQELFNGEADERKIADALLGGTVRLTVDAANLESRAGEAAFVTSFILVARLGIGVEVSAPDAQLLDPVAPLRGRTLLNALVDLGGDLVPGARVRLTEGDVDEEFVFGDCDGIRAEPVHVSATDLAASLTRGESLARTSGDLPFGGFAAAAAVAAAALEAAVPLIETAVGQSAKTPRPSAAPPFMIDLLELFPQLANGINAQIGNVDVISGGAITHALLYCLLRVPALSANLRVVEEQHAELSNVNRYALLRASDDGKLKTAHLEESAGRGIAVSGVPCLFTKETRKRLLPLSGRVLVGVDDVEARWWVQRENPGWLCIGATGNHLAQLTTHVHGGPCAGCAHPVALSPQTIPTISFVSFWAGLLQACALLCPTPPASRNIVVYPFALGGPAAMHSHQLVPQLGCRVWCAASRGVPRESSSVRAGS